MIIRRSRDKGDNVHALMEGRWRWRGGDRGGNKKAAVEVVEVEVVMDEQSGGRPRLLCFPGIQRASQDAALPLALPDGESPF